MRRKLAFCLVSMVIATTTIAQEKRLTIKKSELDEVQFKIGQMIFNNFNFLIEKAFFGGMKSAFQVSARNKGNSAANYTVYVVALSKDGEMVAAYNVEPLFSTHGPGKIETLTSTGMALPNDYNKVSRFLLRVVIQAKR